MSLVHHLVAFGLRQVVGDPADKVVEFIDQRFTDHSRALPRALAEANDRAWQSLAIALAGDGVKGGGRSRPERLAMLSMRYFATIGDYPGAALGGQAK